MWPQKLFPYEAQGRKQTKKDIEFMNTCTKLITKKVMNATKFILYDLH